MIPSEAKSWPGLFLNAEKNSLSGYKRSSFSIRLTGFLTVDEESVESGAIPGNDHSLSVKLSWKMSFGISHFFEKIEHYEAEYKNRPH